MSETQQPAATPPLEEARPEITTPPRIAGGIPALTRSQEGAEDVAADGAAALDARGVGPSDFVIGIAASGTTPYVRGALERAIALGAHTGIIACSPPPAELVARVDVAIVPITGPEAITGSGIAFALAVLLLRRSILTEKISRRGRHISQEFSVDPLALSLARDVMTADPITLPADLPVAEALVFFEREAVHRSYPVTDSDGRPVALVSRADALRWRQEPGVLDGSLGETLEMMELVKAGKIDPIPVEERPLSQASKSLDDLRKGGVMGRVVLKP